MPQALGEQARHVVHMVKAASEQQARSGWSLTLEAHPAGSKPFALPQFDTLAFRPACTPGYYNGEGRPGKGQGLFDNTLWPRGPNAFFALMKAWREAGDMCGLEVR